MQNRRISTQHIIRALDKFVQEIVLQKTHRDRWDLFGSVEASGPQKFRIRLAVETCLKNGGVEKLLQTLLHELLHIYDWDLTENDIETLSASIWKSRSYYLKYRLALAVLEASLLKYLHVGRGR